MLFLLKCYLILTRPSIALSFPTLLDRSRNFKKDTKLLSYFWLNKDTNDSYTIVIR